jgi:glycine dehydrogenase subunit 1
VIFQQPNFFGCLEPAPDLAAAASDAGALSVAHVDLVSLGVLEAPGAYGCSIAIGEGQSAGNFQSYGGPHYGFFAARSEFIRRMPGRISGETVDSDGKRGFVLTLQTREQHIRREKGNLQHHDESDVARAGRPCPSLMAWTARAARAGGDLPRALALREGPPGDAGLELVFADKATFKEFAVRVGRPAKSAIGDARAAGINPGYALGRDYAALDDALLVAVTEKRTTAEIDSLGRGARGVKLVYEEVPPGRRASSLPRPELRRGGARRASPRSPPRLPEISEPELVRHFTALADRTFGCRHGFLPARVVHDEAQPARERARRQPSRLPDLHPLQRRTRPRVRSS